MFQGTKVTTCEKTFWKLKNRSLSAMYSSNVTLGPSSVRQELRYHIKISCSRYDASYIICYTIPQCEIQFWPQRLCSFFILPNNQRFATQSQNVSPVVPIEIQIFHCYERTEKSILKKSLNINNHFSHKYGLEIDDFN